MGDGRTSIDTVHDMVHNGNSFYFFDEATLASIGDKRTIHIKAPGANYMHVVGTYEVFGGSATISVYEDAVVSVNGTDVTTVVQNRNRNISKATNGKLYHTPTVTNYGTQIRLKTIHGTTATSGKNVSANRGQNETIFKRGSSYILELTALDNNVDVSLFLEWYEV